MLDNFWDRFNTNNLIIFLDDLHNSPGSVGNEMDKTPPLFNVRIISIRNSSGLLICSKTCEIIIRSKNKFSKGNFTPSYFTKFSMPAFFK